MIFLAITSYVKQQLSTTPRYYYIGVDLGMKQDYTVIVLVEKTNDKLRLIHTKRPRLNSEYSDVLDHVKMLEKKFKIRIVCVDQTGVGEVFVENAKKMQVRNLKGLMMTQQTKMDLMVNLKQVMQQGRLRLPYDRELMDELNAEIARLSETGKTLFSHRSGTHDDRLWALALAVYVARNTPAEYLPFATLGRRPSFNFEDQGIATIASTFPGLKLAGHSQVDNEQVPSGTRRSLCPVCWKPYTPIPGRGKASPCGCVDENGHVTIKDEPTTVWRSSPYQIGNYNRNYWTN